MDCKLSFDGTSWVCSACGFRYSPRDLSGVDPLRPPRRNCSAGFTSEEHAAKEVARGKIEAGPGTELKRLLGKFRVYAEQGCKCDQRAAVMDSEGPEWCRKNIDVIVGWLREEAVRRGLPFVDAGARVLVRMAIRSSEKKLRMLADG